VLIHGDVKGVLLIVGMGEYPHPSESAAFAYRRLDSEYVTLVSGTWVALFVCVFASIYACGFHICTTPILFCEPITFGG